MSVADVALSPIRRESVHSSSSGYFPGQQQCGSESILIYLTVSGSVIPIRVLESDSIASVKLRIQTCQGFVVKKQKLIFRGKELSRNKSLIRDYGVSDGNVLHLVLKLSDLLIITVGTVCGREFELHVDRYKNVGYLKQRIAKEGKGFVDVDDPVLLCNGEKLRDQTVIDNISTNSDGAIHLLVQKSAKVRAKTVEKDLELSVVAAYSNENESSRDDKGVGGDGDGEDDQSQKLQRVNVMKEPPYRDFGLERIVANPKAELSSFLLDLINATFEGLKSGHQPIRCLKGTGGAYFMQDSSGNEYVSVFKPMDEEPMAVNNPQGLPVSVDGEGLKRGTRVGEGAIREVAAYVLDHPRSGPRSLSGEMMGYAGVPPTTLVQCLHQAFNHPDGFECSSKNVKVGSLQMFMKNDGSCEDLGPRAFPIEEIHKISVLDIRLANADRHAGNILFTKGKEGKFVLTPIDHGYCLPETFEDCTFDWLYWPQAKEPYSPDTIDYINSLDAEQDIALLKFYGWDIPVECARTLHISTMLLKKGVQRGLTPFAIGSIMCRETMKKKSLIEEIVEEARESLLPGMSEDTLVETVSHVMDLQLDKIAK